MLKVRIFLNKINTKEDSSLAVANYLLYHFISCLIMLSTSRVFIYTFDLLAKSIYHHLTCATFCPREITFRHSDKHPHNQTFMPATLMRLQVESCDGFREKGKGLQEKLNKKDISVS